MLNLVSPAAATHRQQADSSMQLGWSLVIDAASLITINLPTKTIANAARFIFASADHYYIDPFLYSSFALCDTPRSRFRVSSRKGETQLERCSSLQSIGHVRLPMFFCCVLYAPRKNGNRLFSIFFSACHWILCSSFYSQYFSSSSLILLLL